MGAHRRPGPLNGASGCPAEVAEGGGRPTPAHRGGGGRLPQKKAAGGTRVLIPTLARALGNSVGNRGRRGKGPLKTQLEGAASPKKNKQKKGGPPLLWEVPGAPKFPDAHFLIFFIGLS